MKLAELAKIFHCLKIKGKRVLTSHSTFRRQPWRHFSLYCNIVERIGFSPTTRATLRRPGKVGRQMYPSPEMEERPVVGNCHYSTVSLSLSADSSLSLSVGLAWENCINSFFTMGKLDLPSESQIKAFPKTKIGLLLGGLALFLKKFPS